jgi:3-methyladenine DNA glycosylase/8-oxoguanine DNA glycosylase
VNRRDDARDVSPAEAQVKKGDSLRGQRREAEAEAAFREAVRLDPTQTRARDHIAMLERARQRSSGLGSLRRTRRPHP